MGFRNEALMLVCEKCHKESDFLVTKQGQQVCIGCADSDPAIPPKAKVIPFHRDDIRNK